MGNAPDQGSASRDRSFTTPRTRLLLMAFVGFVLGAAVSALVAWVIWPDEAAMHDLEIGIHHRLPDLPAMYREGTTCTLSPAPDQQVVISDANGTIVGQIWPANGELRLGTNGSWYCSAFERVSIPGSTFYTFTVNRQEETVMGHGEIEAVGWSITLGWVYGTATPMASPEG